MTSSCNETEPAHRRSASTWAQVPALLKGLIYGPNGRAMSPRHTRRRGRIYRYYVTREAIADGYESCPVTSVPAADVEGAVLDQVQNCWPHGTGHPDLGGGEARIPMRFQRRGGRKRIVAPDGSELAPRDKAAARRHAGQSSRAGVAMAADAR